MPSADTARATAALVARDPALPGLRLLLDDDLLSRWLSGPLGPGTSARRRYLRYKRGTSCVAAVLCDTPQGRRTVVVSAYSPEAAVKARKALDRAPSGSVFGADPALRLLAVTPAADRHLPALARLADPDARARLLRHPGGRLTELAYKPHRRWVGRVDTAEGPYLLRVYRPRDLASALQPVTALAQRDAPTPTVLRSRPRHGVAAVSYAPGTALSADASPEALHAAGRALAALHGSTVELDEAGAAGSAPLQAAARQAGVLLPEVADEAAALGDRLRSALATLRATPPVALHGDFSLDQVVAGPSGAMLIDLDRAGLGPAEADLGSLAASVLADRAHHARVGSVLSGVLSGYSAAGGQVDDRGVATYAAAHLLRRAGEPFREGDRAWAEELRRLLRAAEDALAVGIGA